MIYLSAETAYTLLTRITTLITQRKVWQLSFEIRFYTLRGIKFKKMEMKIYLTHKPIFADQPKEETVEADLGT